VSELLLVPPPPITTEKDEEDTFMLPVRYPPAPPPPALSVPPAPPPATTKYSIKPFPEVTSNVPLEVNVWYLYPPERVVDPPVATKGFHVLFLDC
jgi:hypothetical protein